MRALRRLLLLAALAAVAAAGWLSYFSRMALAPPGGALEFTVKPGAGLKAVSRRLADQGLLPDGESLWILARVLGRGGAIHAGTYRLDRPLTPLELLDKLARGDVMMADIRFVEGTTLRQWLAALAAHAKVRKTAAARDAEAVRALLGLAEPSAEGWLFPDTYRFAPNATDADILRRAHAAMKRRLAAAWAARAPKAPLATPYEALILASIVEKETGVAGERGLIAGVFLNRLARGMRLQTDPTVIYGLGEKYDGNIRKRDLTADTPWNTYTRDGLPPTPIAMPGGAALEAVARPEASEFLYFVGKGDGTHQFSRTLEEHNRAVARYQLKR